MIRIQLYFLMALIAIVGCIYCECINVYMLLTRFMCKHNKTLL